ncbi:hypothetical protein ACPXCS_32270 [Streptomyces sp. DT190]|uniref:hypothetical protein n=1 Tax=unclassified Streptomyces TaxID=2593676 RepID=UPI003CFB50FA
MSGPDIIEAVPVQQAEASGRARVTQVGRDYEEHHHRYVRGWEYLRGVGMADREMDLVENAFVDALGSNGSGQVAHAVSMLNRPHGRRHVLVLLGETGTGRRAAALRVLHSVGVPRERIRWLVLDWDRPRTEQLPHTKGHGFVLDLTACRGLDEDFYTGLADYQQEAEAAEAFLVILATPEGWNPGTLATVPSVRMIRPPATEIAKAHLRHLAADRVDWLSSAPLDALLAQSAEPSDAARLALLVAQAGEDNRDAVKQEFTDWQDHLQKWFEKHSNPEDLRERALLVATALLEGVPADVVLDAADRLFAEVGGVQPPGGALAGRGLDERLHAIKASQDDDEALSLEARQHGLPEAVLKYVWRQRPQLRRVLLQWASHISAPNGVAVRHLRRIADCLVQLSLLPGGSVVQLVASDWIATGRSAHRELAVEVLETMALHPVTGAGVRKQLYDWAHQKGTSKELATAVADICAGRLGQTYPRIALTRLRLLASRSDGLAREAVAEAVRRLASTPEQRILVLSEIVGWAEAADSDVREAGTDTFLALTDIACDTLLPVLAARETGEDAADTLAGELFVRGWRAALQDPNAAGTAHARLAAWLDSPRLSDDQVLPLAAAVLHGHLGQRGAAELLVGSSGSSDLGRMRRRLLLDLLISQQTASPAEPGSAAEPGNDGIVTAA